MLYNEDNMVITVIGAGYVGLTDAAIFANGGYKVYAIDTNNERLDIIKSGHSFFHEANLNPLIKKAIDNGNLIPTSSYEQAISESDVIFSCVGTPDNPDGSSNLTYVYSVAETVAGLIGDSKKIFVQKSTVPVGTGEKIEVLFKKHNSNVSYVSNPEFLREGSAIIDSLWFDRIVVGSKDKEANEIVLNIYKQIFNSRSTIADLAEIDKKPDEKPGEYITTSVNSAELIKVTSNAFLAMKITFANSIAKLADATNADIKEVMYGVGADPRIGRSFLNAGRGFGGGCFPKDVSGLMSTSIEHGVEIDILHAITQENESMPGYIIEKAMKAFGSNFTNKKVAVLGLSYKAATSDVRESPSLKIANLLSSQRDVTVHAYDPAAIDEALASNKLSKGVTIASSTEDALKDADAVFIATDWAEFTSLDLSTYVELMNGTLFVDCMNAFSPDKVTASGLSYIGIGR